MGKEKQPMNHHPWVFSGAIGSPKQSDIEKVGHLVKVNDHKERFIAYGWCDINSHIMVRLLSWNESVIPDEAWWANQITQSVLRRKDMITRHRDVTNAYRLIHGEADFLPGVVADLYADTIVVLLSASVAIHYELALVNALEKLLSPSVIYVYFDSSFVHTEHTSEFTHIYKDGKMAEEGEEISPVSKFLENSYYYILDAKGQKSGFYCDQRDNRAIVSTYTKGKNVLDAFSYTGGFTINALGSGADSVTSVDSSARALSYLNKNIALNVLKGVLPEGFQSKVTCVKANVFEYLREIKENEYDVIILDPPKLAATKSQVPQALKAYKDLNRLAISKVKRGGIIASFSCSAGVSSNDLQTAIAWAAKDAGKEVHIRAIFSQGPDHPIRLSFPESHYLKGFLLFVL